MVASPRDTECLALTVASVACAGHFPIPLIFSASASSGTALPCSQAEIFFTKTPKRRREFDFDLGQT
jgi:hypothetical protein